MLAIWEFQLIQKKHFKESLNSDGQHSYEYQQTNNYEEYHHQRYISAIFAAVSVIKHKFEEKN